jgi:CRP-like cAMP-binding protein
VLLSGRAEVVRGGDGADDSGRRLATLDVGDLFGEMSLLTHEPAVATVRTTSKCFVLQLPDNVFREIIMTHPQVLMFVGDLADQRRRENAAIIDGTADYAEGHVELV